MLDFYVPVLHQKVNLRLFIIQTRRVSYPLSFPKDLEEETTGQTHRVPCSRIYTSTVNKTSLNVPRVTVSRSHSVVDSFFLICSEREPFSAILTWTAGVPSPS